MNILRADYDNPEHEKAIQTLMNHYAQDPMGGGEALSELALNNMVKGLKAFGRAVTMLAYVDNQPVGLINCIEGFSTFKAKPLLNIHDVVVLDGFRGKGITQSMLKAVENYAIEIGCCKLTLEVLEGNKPARRAYENYGFAAYELDPEMGSAMFWQKLLA